MDMEHERAVDFVKWYKDLLENHCERLYVYISPDVYLDWFGRVVRGNEQVSTFFKKTSNFEHRIDNVETRSFIWHKDFKPLKTKPSHKIPVEEPVTPLSLNSNNDISDCSYLSKPGCSHESESNHRTFPEVSIHEERNEPNVIEEDGNFCTPEKTSVTIQYPIDIGAGDAAKSSLKYVAVFGTLFLNARTSESTDFNTRPLKLKVAYTEDIFGNEYTIKYMIYETKNKCRRNLMPQFQSVSNEVTDNECN